MRVLVTGAAGFLGRAVVAALLERGHEVRALVRSGTDSLPREVEQVEGDLRTQRGLERHLADVDTVVHLAASMSGSDFSRFSETIVGTEALLNALPSDGRGRLILCSSFSVYDWEAATGTVDERLPENPRIYRNGGYATAKLWQERIARRFARARDWELTIVRPGFIWGPGNEVPSGSLGPRLGRFQCVFAPRRRLPFTQVANCADCIAACVSSPEAAGEVLNVVDDFQPRAWEFARIAQRREEGPRVVLLPIPYFALRAVVALSGWLGRALLGPRAKLPSFLTPSRFAQGYKPLRYDMKRIRDTVGWRAPLDFERTIEATWDADSTSSARRGAEPR